MVKKSEITGENTFNGDHFEIETNHGSSKCEKTFRWVFLQNCDQCINPQTAKKVYLRFWSIVWVLKFLGHFQWVLETRNKLNLFYTKFVVNRGRFFVYMYQLVASQKTNIVKLLAFIFRFQAKERVLRVNKSNITCEKTFNGDHFENSTNNGSRKDEKLCFGRFCKFVTSA